MVVNLRTVTEAEMVATCRSRAEICRQGRAGYRYAIAAINTVRHTLPMAIRLLVWRHAQFKGCKLGSDSCCVRVTAIVMIPVRVKRAIDFHGTWRSVTLSASYVPSSIFDLEPLDRGGIEARDGFALQDHIAAGFCLDMMADAALAEVWCETHDDITLIWNNGDPVVEFVQVKGGELNQLWTVAKLCDRESKEGIGSRCILEKSLSQDRCCERTRFRIVTSRPVAQELKILTMPFGTPGRDGEAGTKAMEALHVLLKAKVASFNSPNGNGYAFWTTSAFWDVRHAEDSVRNDSIIKLTKLLQGKDIFLAIDQVEELYTKLLKKVWDASRADPRVAPDRKRSKRTDFERWLLATATEISLPSAGAAENVQRKMGAAGLADDVIQAALEQRRHYRHEVLSQKYLCLDDRHMIEGEVTAVLQSLKSRLDNSAIPDDGIGFHDICLKALDELREDLPMQPKPPRAFLQGCMYSITGRCLHRFRKVMA